uniref:Dynein heavy chain ATP-binding dynein motor region domain-containing protein n=1 Tax=Hucho hucho TaxID=62062 RepID=A0A4W5RAP3_9TELE
MNFTVTRDGLEDQLLAAVVSMERPDLEELKWNLTKQQNGFKITLKILEDNLLSRLSSASGNFLGDTELVENLEITKRTAAEIEEKVWFSLFYYLYFYLCLFLSLSLAFSLSSFLSFSPS